MIHHLLIIVVYLEVAYPKEVSLLEANLKEVIILVVIMEVNQLVVILMVALIMMVILIIN